jgi:hypothetical protein
MTCRRSGSGSFPFVRGPTRSVDAQPPDRPAPLPLPDERMPARQPRVTQLRWRGVPPGRSVAPVLRRPRNHVSPTRPRVLTCRHRNTRRSLRNGPGVEVISDRPHAGSWPSPATSTLAPDRSSLRPKYVRVAIGEYPCPSGQAHDVGSIQRPAEILERIPFKRDGVHGRRPATGSGERKVKGTSAAGGPWGYVFMSRSRRLSIPSKLWRSFSSSNLADGKLWRRHDPPKPCLHLRCRRKQGVRRAADGRNTI